MTMRVMEDDEIAGLDSMCHGETAYGEQGTPTAHRSSPEGGAASDFIEYTKGDSLDVEAQITSVRSAISRRHSVVPAASSLDLEAQGTSLRSAEGFSGPRRVRSAFV